MIKQPINLLMGALASKLVQHPWSSTSLNGRRLRSALHRGKYLTQANVSEFDLHDIILNHSLQLFSSLGKTKTNSAPPLSIPVLTCQPSTNAIGDGIFAGSRLLPGTVVAFFPGIAYLGVPYGKDDERPQPRAGPYHLVDRILHLVQVRIGDKLRDRGGIHVRGRE